MTNRVQIPGTAIKMVYQFLQPAFHSVAWVLMLGCCSVAMGQCAGKAELSDSDRAAFASALYGQREEVTVHVLSAEGCGHAVLESLAAGGAHITFADERVGYAALTVPKRDVMNVLDLRGIAFASVMPQYKAPLRPQPSNDRKPSPVLPIQIPIPRVAKTLAKDGPYFAADEAGLTSLWQRHPRADGRGVRVAVVDEGFDLLHPALELARDANGKLIPKVADVMTLNTPEEDVNFVQFGEPIETINGTFSAVGRTWTAPRDGIYRFGIFTNVIHLGPWLGKFRVVKEDPHLRNVPLSIGVLWDEKINRVWVDTDGDGSFQNQRALADYSETHDVDYFGEKEGEDDNRIPFGVKIDHTKRTGYLSIADGPHGAYVAGPLAANWLTGGLFDGAAPAVQLIDARTPSSNDNLPGTFASIFARADVDVVNRSGSIGVGVEFNRHLVDRLAEMYNKPIACFCAGANTIFVLDYQSPEMLRRNRQAPPPYVEASHGGALFDEDGLVNTILAPSASLTTQSRYMPEVVPWEDGRLHAGNAKALFDSPAPNGYSIGANPSATIPIVSGILADLISEARRQHVRYNARRLTQAILTGTRLVQGISTYEQGFGLVDAAAAWSQLVEMARVDDPKNAVLTSFTLARLKDGHFKEVYGFHADLAQPGGVLDEELWITRHGGYAIDRSCELSLRGNDGTYELVDRKIVSPPNKAVRVRFKAKVEPGYHLAFLQLIDAQAHVVIQEIPLLLRSPHVPDVSTVGVEKYQRTTPPRRKGVLLVRLGEDAQAARFVLRVPDDGGSSSLVSWRSVPGLETPGVDSNGAFVPLEGAAGKPLDATHHVGPIEEFESLIANVETSTQEVFWGNRAWPEYETPYEKPAPDVPINTTVTVTKYAVSFALENSQSVRVTNKLAAINGKVEWYGAKVISSDVGGSGVHDFALLERRLPAKLSQWRVSVSSAKGIRDAVDAYLLLCPDQGCTVVQQKPLRSEGALFVIDAPQEGNWRVVVRTRATVEQPCTYRIREALLIPNVSNGEVGDQQHATNATWSVPIPPNETDAQYVAFRIAASAGNEQRKNEAARTGLRIAMTPLNPGGF